ncbi:MAG: hypothetical protein NTW25_08925 [Candidatus Kapabacteria bacterium]|nr:hypothetical protein [Candidatus Kapabacteria bacterium]
MQNEFKVAFVSTNKKSINGSFGGSKYFEVFTIKNGEIELRETRETFVDNGNKVLPNILTPLDKSNQNNGIAKSFSLNVVDKSKEKHLKIARTISDCDFVVARGMCANAHDSILQLNMKPIRTKVKTFEEGVKQIANGTIISYELNE